LGIYLKWDITEYTIDVKTYRYGLLALYGLPARIYVNNSCIGAEQSYTKNRE